MDERPSGLRSVYLIRHAEKPLGDPPPHGVSIDGDRDTESLTPRGWQRAGALASHFVPPPDGVMPNGLATPTHLFASLPGPGIGSRRSLETLTPLAERLGLRPDVRFHKDHLVGLVEAVRAASGTVLIAWEHHLIPQLGGLLAGDAAAVPTVWPDDRYDVIWVFEPAAAGRGLTFRQVPLLLLAGDRPDPMGLIGG